MFSQLRPWVVLTVAVVLAGCAGCGATSGNTAGNAPVALVLTTEANICRVDPSSSPPPAAFLVVTSQPITCAQPALPPLPGMGCGAGEPAFWEICVDLQTLTPATIDLQSQKNEVWGVSIAAGCSAGVEGLNVMGSLTIEMVDPSSVTFTLSGSDQSTIPGEFTPDGTYDAARCP